MSYTNADDLVIEKPPSRKKAWTLLIIRIIILLALVYGIFLETGICTALFALFIIMGAEIRGHLMKKLINDVMGLYAAVSVIFTGRFPPLDKHHNPYSDADDDGVD